MGLQEQFDPTKQELAAPWSEDDRQTLCLFVVAGAYPETNASPLIDHFLGLPCTSFLFAASDSEPW